MLYLFLLEDLDCQLVQGSRVDRGYQDLLQAPERRLLLEALGGLGGQRAQGHHHPDNHKYTAIIYFFVSVGLLYDIVLVLCYASAVLDTYHD